MSVVQGKEAEHMSVTIDVCKDIEKFKESVMAGFDAKHSIVIVGALLAGGITCAVCIMALHIPAIISGYLMLPVSGPIIFIGFSEQDGMSFFERRKKKKLIKKMKLCYISTENFQYLKTYENEIINKTMDSKENEDIKKYITFLTAGALGIVIIFIIAIALILVLH